MHHHSVACPSSPPPAWVRQLSQVSSKPKPKPTCSESRLNGATSNLHHLRPSLFLSPTSRSLSLLAERKSLASRTQTLQALSTGRGGSRRCPSSGWGLLCPDGLICGSISRLRAAAAAIIGHNYDAALLSLLCRPWAKSRPASRLGNTKQTKTLPSDDRAADLA